MCRDVTPPGWSCRRLAVACWMLLPAMAAGQSIPPAPAGVLPDWRHVGTSTYEARLPSPATGPAERVWHSQDGGRLFIRTASGSVFAADAEGGDWQPAPTAAPPDEPPPQVSASLPEAGAVVRAADSYGVRLYAFGRDVHRSEDAGKSWENLTRWRDESILGDGIRDLAVAPGNPDVVVVVNEFGVWRSADGGLSWYGLNEGLPNLPVRRLTSTPQGAQGVKIALSNGAVLEWAPGERHNWTPARDEAFQARETARYEAALATRDRITAADLGEEFSYAGSDEGKLYVSQDGGASWRWSRLGDGWAAEAIFVVPGLRSTAYVGFSAPADGEPHPRVLRTTDGGVNWTDVTGDLPPGPVWGVAGDASGTALYVASERGVYFSLENNPVQPVRHWILLSGNLPPAPAVDVRLDEGGYQVFVALAGYGVFAAPAPHRFWNVGVANAADFSTRPAAPGSLLTVLGGRLLRAQAGLLPAPVLFASAAQSQLQVPFEASGSDLQLSVEMEQGQVTLSVPLAQASPAIFVDRDGAALLMDGDTGLLLDSENPARSGMRVQILATGLGRVVPSWKTGEAAPAVEPPRVAVPVRAYLGGAPVEVSRAILAPGYIGFYLVEILLPSLADAGASELYLEASGRQSNKVRIYIDP